MEFTQTLKKFLAVGTPAAAASFCGIAMITVNMVATGHIGGQESIAAVGVGVSFMTLFVNATHYGMNSAIDTLVSQAFGSGNLKLCGMYLQRGRVICCFTLLPISILFIFSQPILISLGFQKTIVDIAHEFLLWQIPNGLLIGLVDLQRRFLIQTGHSFL